MNKEKMIADGWIPTDYMLPHYEKPVLVVANTAIADYGEDVHELAVYKAARYCEYHSFSRDEPADYWKVFDTRYYAITLHDVLFWRDLPEIHL